MVSVRMDKHIARTKANDWNLEAIIQLQGWDGNHCYRANVGVNLVEGKVAWVVRINTPLPFYRGDLGPFVPGRFFRLAGLGD